MVIINLLLLLALHVITIFGYVLMRKWLPSAGFKYQQEPACSAGLGCWEEGRGALDQASIPATNHCLCFGLVVFLFLCFCFWGGCLLGFFFSQQATNFQSLWQDKTWNFFSCKNQSFVRWKSCKLFFFFFSQTKIDLSCEDIQSILLCFTKCIKYGDGIWLSSPQGFSWGTDINLQVAPEHSTFHVS